MTGETLDKVFERAAELNPSGEVGIESFRSVLDACQADEIKAAIAEQGRKSLAGPA